jgi:hypothetical protein
MSAYQDYIVLRPLLLAFLLHREAVMGLEPRESTKEVPRWADKGILSGESQLSESGYKGISVRLDLYSMLCCRETQLDSLIW